MRKGKKVYIARRIHKLSPLPIEVIELSVEMVREGVLSFQGLFGTLHKSEVAESRTGAVKDYQAVLRDEFETVERGIKGCLQNN